MVDRRYPITRQRSGRTGKPNEPGQAVGKTAVVGHPVTHPFHEEFVERHGRGVIPAKPAEFTTWWFSMYPDLPPRLANGCVWLGIEYKTV